MVCRESSLGSAMATLARGNSGLADNQCLSLMHALMREGASTQAPDSEEWNGFIDQLSADVRSGALLIPPRTRGLMERLEAARTEQPDGPRFYSIQRILRRVTVAAASHQEWITDQARSRGVTVEAVTEEFDRYFAEASRNASRRPTREFRSAFLEDPTTAACLSDNRSLYAYEQIVSTTRSVRASQPSRPSVERRPVNSSAIAEIGYDPVSGRCEIVMNNNQSRVYAYRLTQDEYNEFVSAPSLGSHFARNIRGNPQYQYSSIAEMENGATLNQCATCGQFTGDSHSCPPLGSQEAINRDARRAAERLRPDSVVPEQEIPRMPRTRSQRVYSQDGEQIMRLPTVNRLRQEARRNTEVLAPVLASGPTDETDSGTYDVSGSVQVSYLGRGQGYAVAAVTAPGDSRVDNLRCNCPQYRAQYRCPHINQVVANVSAALNEGVNVDAVAAARAQVTAALASDYADSVAATDIAEAAWIPVSTPLMDNPEVFQGMYDEFRSARTVYKEALAIGDGVPHPVPYYEENALGGLGTRALKRGFGTEIEFSFPSDFTQEERRDALRKIGEELYEAGLTRSPDQKPYGDSHGWVRDTHERGWAFEDDPSTGGYWGGDEPISGGEIIAPIMFDERDTWVNIEKVCSILKRNGAMASKSAGLHVHVGVGDYDHRIENHNRLLASVAENEDLLYRMSSNPERGSHRGRYYCSPNHIPTAPYRTLSSAKNGHIGHSLAVNMQGVNGGDGDHVEFRTFDSTLEPSVIQSQIAMSVYMAEGATRPSSTSLDNAERHPLGERYNANPRRTNLSGEDWDAATAPVRKFIDNFVPGNGGDDAQNPQVRQIVALFAMTRWQKTR